MIRFTAASLAVLALAASSAASAKDVDETRTFTKADGTQVVSRTALNTKTDVTHVTVTTTRTDGQVRTAKETISPDHVGGFNVSKSVTGFNGQTHTSTSSVGGGHGGHGKG